jgi:hypothetical protein
VAGRCTRFFFSKVECTRLLVIYTTAKVLDVINCDRNADGGVPRFPYGNYMHATTTTSLSEAQAATGGASCHTGHRTSVPGSGTMSSMKKNVTRPMQRAASAPSSAFAFCRREHDDRLCTR